MALEVLEDEKTIGGVDVAIMDKIKEEHPEMFGESGQMDYKRFEEEFRPKFPVQIRLDKNSISFTIQKGPIKEVGVNGCQVDTLIYAAKKIIEKLNDKFPHACNERALMHLRKSIEALADRTKDRESRGVEGTNQI